MTSTITRWIIFLATSTLSLSYILENDVTTFGSREISSVSPGTAQILPSSEILNLSHSIGLSIVGIKNGSASDAHRFCIQLNSLRATIENIISHLLDSIHRNQIYIPIIYFLFDLTNDTEKIYVKNWIEVHK